jgi:hypothetical protein
MKLYTRFVYSTLYLSTVVAQSCNFLLSNGCVSFAVSAGTGCAWMCQYCANALGTNNYYFTDSVCTYQQGTGCVGNPQVGKTYTCCSV